MKKIKLCILIGLMSINLHSQIYGSGIFDLDNNSYESIIVGDQEWMSSNLKSTKYSTGENIEHIIDSAVWTNTFTGAWSYFHNNQSYDSLFGKLYNWYSIQDNRNVCPVGWKVPTKMDWEILTDYLGGYEIAGGKLKISGTELWISPNVDATNETGFAGYPSGSRSINGGFPNTISKPFAVWWTSTYEGNSQSWYADLHHSSSYVQYGLGSLKGGLPIRCLKNTGLASVNNHEHTKFTVYPNPAENDIHVFGLELSKSADYIIFDTKGVKIIQGNLINETIDISKLEIGIYYLELTHKGSRIGFTKIIKK